MVNDNSLIFKQITLNWTLRVPKNDQHSLIRGGMNIEFFANGRTAVFSLHTLSFRIRITVVVPDLVASHYCLKK